MCCFYSLLDIHYLTFACRVLNKLTNSEQKYIVLHTKQNALPGSIQMLSMTELYIPVTEEMPHGS